MIESWGRGTNKIVEIAVQAGLPQPEFENHRLWFTVRFHATPESTPVDIPKGLPPLQVELLKVLGSIGPATLGEIEEEVAGDFDRRQIQRGLQALRRLGIVELIGVRRGARWIRVRAMTGV